MIEKSKQSCPSCFSKDIIVFHNVDAVPVNSVLNLRTRERAVHFQRADIKLGFCKKCGFVYNTAFDPRLLQYTSECEESQEYSTTFNQFLNKTAVELIEKYRLRNKTILEIGCGKGEFLTLLCELGNNLGIGFDPAYVEGRHKSKSNNNPVFIKDFYSKKYSSYQADFICCRMTLEHISDAAKFVSMVRSGISNPSKAVVFFQVPDVTRILENCAFEDIYYEHCSYFSPASLNRLFRLCGFEVLDLETVYEGQYIMLAARPREGETGQAGRQAEDDLKTLMQLVNGFQELYRTKMDYWHNQLQEIKSNGKKAVLWGSGSKGVAFLTTLNISREIEYVVDINPYRQGTYMAGTGQYIVEPEFLRTYRPDTVIIMNAVYSKEIRKALAEMRLKPETLIL